MNGAISNVDEARPSILYWRLWVLNAVLVSAAVLFFLATQYATFEFFGAALIMALFPFIPVIVLVGGAGSTVFALTRVLIDKRRLSGRTALTLLMGPGLVLTLLLVAAGFAKTPVHRLSFICLGHPPASAHQVRVTGFSAFLRGEWLATFQVAPADFDKWVADAELVPVDGFEVEAMLKNSLLNKTSAVRTLPPLDNCRCFKRVFKEGQEKERGSVYAAFDPSSSVAVVLYSYHD